jgi:hypothetical protein
VVGVLKVLVDGSGLVVLVDLGVVLVSVLVVAVVDVGLV